MSTSFHSLLRDKEQPWCLWGCGDLSASVPRASGRGHRGALLEAAQEEEAGTGVSSDALTLSIFLLTCSKERRSPGSPWSSWLSQAHPGAQHSISSSFCCRRKVQMSETEQGWASRGHFQTSRLLHVFFWTAPALQSSFPRPAQTVQMPFVQLGS